MTAARPVSGETTAAQASATGAGSRELEDSKSSGTTEQAEQEIAALAAASHQANRGVTLRQIPTTNSDLEQGGLASQDAMALAASSAKDATSTETWPEKQGQGENSSDNALATDSGAGLNVQALIDIALAATINPVPNGHKALTDATTGLDEGTDSPSAVGPMAAELAMTIGIAEDTVENLTASDTFEHHLPGQGSIQTGQGLSTDPQHQKNPALQAVSWFDGANASQKHASDGGENDPSSASATALMNTADAQNLLGATHQGEAPSQLTSSNIATTTNVSLDVEGEEHLDADELKGIAVPAAADSEYSQKRARELQAARQIETAKHQQLAEDLLAGNKAADPHGYEGLQNSALGVESDIERAAGDQDLSADSYAVMADQAIATPDTASMQLAIRSDDHPSLEAISTSGRISNTASTGSPDVDTESNRSMQSNLQSASTNTESGLTGENSSRDANKIGASTLDAKSIASAQYPTTTASINSGETAPATWEQGFSKQAGTPNRSGSNEPDASQVGPEQDDVGDENIIVNRQNSNNKGDINIRELMKFGVTDVALDFQPPALQGSISKEMDQQTQIQGLPIQQTASQQTAVAASSNLATNGERRTIADDIRLRALERMVVNAARNGTQILSIQLYPPGLGQVVLRLAMDGQRLRLATRAATAEAADTLRNMEADLRDALAGNGLQLAGFDVSEDETNDEAPRRQPVEPVVKTRNGGAKESFIVDLNA